MCDITCKASTDRSDKGRQRYTELDYQLHREFARITRNNILLEMFETIKDTFLGARSVWEKSDNSDGNIERGNESHIRIVNAIINGNGPEAMREMQQHLDNMTVMIKTAQKDTGKNE